MKTKTVPKPPCMKTEAWTFPVETWLTTRTIRDLTLGQRGFLVELICHGIIPTDPESVGTYRDLEAALNKSVRCGGVTQMRRMLAELIEAGVVRRPVPLFGGANWPKILCPEDVRPFKPKGEPAGNGQDETPQPSGSPDPAADAFRGRISAIRSDHVVMHGIREAIPSDMRGSAGNDNLLLAKEIAKLERDESLGYEAACQKVVLAIQEYAAAFQPTEEGDRLMSLQSFLSTKGVS